MVSKLESLLRDSNPGDEVAQNGRRRFALKSYLATQAVISFREGLFRKVHTNSRYLSSALSKGNLGVTLTILISNKHFAIQHLVVTQYIIQHLLVKILWRILKCDFHASGFLRFQVNVTEDLLGH